jgi:hypothetical protein
VAKSLKEALLEQMATLQERGLAPGELPVEQEEEHNYYSHFDDDSGGRFGGSGGDREPRRRGGRAPRAGGAPAPRGGRPGTLRPREQRELREAPRREAPRREREGRQPREIPSDLVGPMPSAPRPPMGPRPMGPGGPGGPPRPPMGGGPMGGPMGGPRPPSRADMLRRNAERMQREQQERTEIVGLLSGYAGEEVDEAGVEKFFGKLAVETGALPPLNVVLAALRNAGQADPTEVGNQVRLYYRKARSRAPQAPVAVG